MAETSGNVSGLWRFVFDQLPVRGALVRIGEEWRELLSHRAYPESVRQLLGEAMAAAPLLASTLKFSGQLTLQAESEGTVKLLLVQINDQLEMRGMARHEGQIGATDLGLLASGRLGMIIEPADKTSRYQTLVPLVGERLQQSLIHYFQQSEQLPTWLMLVAGETSLGGLMLQRLPQADADAEAAEEAWYRLGLLADTLQKQELLELAPERLLHRLFHQDAYQLFEPQSVHLGCRCSHGRISEMLLGLGKKEVDDILAEQGKLEIECGFCGRQYTYTKAEVMQLFGAESASPEPGRFH